MKAEAAGKHISATVNIFHSRFIKKDRAKLEEEIIKFGKTYDKNGNLDKQSGIWIATSIVEASLDIDFDYLFTELLDLNSLFQRFGRCNRKGAKNVTMYNCYVYTLSLIHIYTATANRKYKDTVFRMLFSDRKNLLSLYNACLLYTS